MCADLKMAKLWILLAVTLSIELVAANVCSEFEKIMNCNECFRCGGYWCNDPKQDVHCFQAIEDSWCSTYSEIASTGDDFHEAGDLLDPKYSEKTVFVNRNSAIQINYMAASEPSVKFEIVNSTQNNDFYVTKNTHCREGQCTTLIEATPMLSFCSVTGRTSESVNLKISFEGLSEETTVKYKVPCACACSETVEKNAKVCNGHGDLSCGVCTCSGGWTGANCESRCEARRGDVQCTNPNNNLECSGNGKCGPCETCVCFSDRIGSKYFDKNYFCADICMTVHGCDECLRDPNVGKCPYCHFSLFYQNFNETLLEERDDLNRSVWVTCHETFPDKYQVKYMAKRDEHYNTYFMIPPSDEKSAAFGAGGVNVTLPIVLAMIAAVAAVGGFVAYKFWQNRLPPVPLADPVYTNIDAEDCRGENPIYKPPTSSFKNPTYGKW